MLELHSDLFDRLPESIGNLQKLEILDIMGNFKSLPETIGNCVSLKEFKIKNRERGRTDECRLPAAMANLADLRSVSIIDYPVKNLPNLSKWEKLCVLRLIRTSITDLPKNINNLPSLQYLDLSGSPVDELPETIGALANLECLDICDTNIKKFPQSMGNLSKWSQLTINEVNMTALLESVAELRHLPYIEVINPKIRRIPQSLKDRDDFYYNGNREHPRICAELWDKNGVTSGMHFLSEPFPVRVLASVIEFFIYLPRNIRFAVISLIRRNKK
jgi:internalin A